PPPDEDPGQPADRDVAAVIRGGRVVAPVEPVFPVGIAEAVEVSDGVAHHVLHAACLSCICRQVQLTSIPSAGGKPGGRMGRPPGRPGMPGSTYCASYRGGTSTQACR